MGFLIERSALQGSAGHRSAAQRKAKRRKAYRLGHRKAALPMGFHSSLACNCTSSHSTSVQGIAKQHGLVIRKSGLAGMLSQPVRQTSGVTSTSTETTK